MLEFSRTISDDSVAPLLCEKVEDCLDRFPEPIQERESNNLSLIGE